MYSQILCSYSTLNVHILQLGACNVSMLERYNGVNVLQILLYSLRIRIRIYSYTTFCCLCCCCPSHASQSIQRANSPSTQIRIIETMQRNKQGRRPKPTDTREPQMILDSIAMRHFKVRYLWKEPTSKGPRGRGFSRLTLFAQKFLPQYRRGYQYKCSIIQISIKGAALACSASTTP